MMGFVRDVKNWFWNDVSREPQRKRRFWLPALGGLVIAVLGVIGPVLDQSVYDAKFVLLGLAVSAMGAAELVPPGREAWVRPLRASTWVGVALYFVWVVREHLWTASDEIRLIALAMIPFAVGYVWLMYRALKT